MHPIRHLFVIAPNNSGSTLLREAIASSTGCWTLPREGQHAAGFAGPSTRGTGTRLIWAASAERLAQFSARDYDWAAIRAAWAAAARARDPDSHLFVTSSPPFLLHVAALREQFAPARFVFLVRNPYAIVESILRRSAQQALAAGETIVETASTHALRCLQIQRRNLERHGGEGIALRYEDLCAAPGAAAACIRGLDPALASFEWPSALEVKREAQTGLDDRNPLQIARLDTATRARINAIFDRDREALADLGYDRID